MKYQFVTRPIARRNLAAIERWYDERSEGLSDKFRVALKKRWKESIDSLSGLRLSITRLAALKCMCTRMPFSTLSINQRSSFFE